MLFPSQNMPKTNSIMPITQAKIKIFAILQLHFKFIYSPNHLALSILFVNPWIQQNIKNYCNKNFPIIIILMIFSHFKVPSIGKFL